MNRDEARRSRIIASADRLGDDHLFLGKRVLLTGEVEVLTTPNGAEIARTAMQLLMRSSGRLSISLPSTCCDLESILRQDAGLFAWDALPDFIPPDTDFAQYDAILSVGSEVRPDLPWTTISSNGWLARVSSGSLPIPGPCDQVNPVGALAAASLGVCEVFKRLIRLKPDYGDLLDGVTFSLYELKSTSEPGPEIDGPWTVDLMLNGAGAIGSAVGHLLALLPINGTLTIVDNQDYGPENWGTCLDLTLSEAEGGQKAPTLAKRISPNLAVMPEKGDLEDIRTKKIGKALPRPKIILNGLDKVAPRHQSQDMWPDVVIDGALNSELQVRVGVHPWEGDVACLRCTFKEAEGESARAIQLRATGLPSAVLDDQLRELTEADVESARPEHRDALRLDIGRAVCSVVEEKVAQMLSEDALTQGFAPSVPFAASMAASLIVTELVRYLRGDLAILRPALQFSMLFGPENGDVLNDRRHGDCLCVRRRNVIAEVRKGWWS